MKDAPKFTPARRIEIEFRRAIDKLLRQTLDIPPGSTIGEILDRIGTVVSTELATLFSRRMVGELRVSNARSWREAARISGRGREIYQALSGELQGPVGDRMRELIRENAELITSIPDDLRQAVNREISGLQQQGLRSDVIAEYLRKRVPKLARTKAALIARTETAKAALALTEARSEGMGIDWYQWQTAEDQRVRDAHRAMNKVLVAWADPPAPEQLVGEESEGNYHAGGIYNCRCISLPIVDLDLVQWPAKVYSSGRVQRMTRGAFQKLSGMDRRLSVA